MVISYIFLIIIIIIIIILSSYKFGGWNKDEYFLTDTKEKSYIYTDKHTKEILARPTYIELYGKNKITGLCAVHNYKIALLNLLLPRKKPQYKDTELFSELEKPVDDDKFINKYLNKGFFIKERDYAFEFFKFISRSRVPKPKSILSIGIPVGRYIANYLGIKKYRNVIVKGHELPYEYDDLYDIITEDELKKNKYDMIFITYGYRKLSGILYKICKYLVGRTYIVHNFMDLMLAELSHKLNFGIEYKTVGSPQVKDLLNKKYFDYIDGRYVLNYHNGIVEYTYYSNENITIVKSRKK